MKAEINAGGCLIIKPENELEAYALGKWKEADGEELNNPIKKSSIKVDPNLPGVESQ